MTTNAYEILGISPDASDPDIKRAYRKLAMEYHPDRNDSVEAKSKIKKVNEAYETLSDPSKKREHDAILHMGNRPNNSSHRDKRFDQFFNQGPLRGFEDFFSNIYGNNPNSHHSFTPHTHVQSETSLILEEVITGAKRKFAVNGDEYEINIPPGVRENEVLRAVLDDNVELHLRVKFLPHSVFTKRSGINIYARVDVPLRLAISGGEIHVPTLDGQILLAIPKGTSSHTKLRAAGRGLWRKSQIGDAFYEVRIKIPTIEDSASAVIEQLLKNQSDE